VNTLTRARHPPSLSESHPIVSMPAAPANSITSVLNPPSASDAPQRFVVSYTYTLPFFKLTHRFKRLTDDWNLSGIYTLQHGFPIAVRPLRGHLPNLRD